MTEEAKPPETLPEFVEIPDQKGGDEASPPDGSGSGKTGTPSLATFVGLLDRSVALMHSKAADATKYEGWRLTDDEKGFWHEANTAIAEYFPVKMLPLAVMLIILLTIEGLKFWGWMDFKKQMASKVTPR